MEEDYNKRRMLNIKTSVLGTGATMEEGVS